MSERESTPPSEGTSESPLKMEERKGAIARRIFSTISILLVLLGTPLTITIGYLFHTDFSEVFKIWTYVTMSTLLILSVFSVFEMLKEEAKRSEERNLTALKRDLFSLFSYKHIVIPLLVLSILSGLGSVSHVFTPIFSLQLLYTAVVILIFETIFHSLYRFWPRFLKENLRLRNATLTLLVILGIFVSLFVIGIGAVELISLVFGGILLVGGIGLAFVVDTVASDLSRSRLPKRKATYASFLAFFLLLVLWLLLSSNLLKYLVLLANGSGGTLVSNLLVHEFQSLTSGLNISLISVIMALGAGAIYFAYLFFKRSYDKRLERFVFLMVSLPVAGFIFLYLAILADGDWVAATTSSVSVLSSFLQVMPSIVLFVVGYSQIIIEVPRKSSKTLMLEENEFLVALTWLLVFSAISEFLSWLVYGKPGLFIFEVDILQWFGIPIGIALISVNHLRSRRNSRTSPG